MGGALGHADYGEHEMIATNCRQHPKLINYNGQPSPKDLIFTISAGCPGQNTMQRSEQKPAGGFAFDGPSI